MKYPEMTKANHRHRGPMESRKMNNSMRDIRRSIELLKEEFKKREASSHKLMANLLLEYNYTIPGDRKEVVNGVQSVRGGEL